MSAVRQRAVGNPVVWSMWVCAATVVLGCGDEGSGDGTLLGPPVESGSNGGGSVDAGEGAGSEDGGEMVDEGLLWIDIDLGPRVSCGIRAEGSLWCWGDVLLLGHSSDGSELEPTPHKVVDELGWRQVSAGQSHACALRDDGTVWCWGFNRCGRLGQDPQDDGHRAVPVQEMSHGRDWQQVRVKAGTTCATKQDGSVWCWGIMNEIPSAARDRCVGEPELLTREEVPVDWRSTDIGGAHRCGVEANGTLWCWGRNSSGQLGLGHTDWVSGWAQEVTGATDWLEVQTESDHTCALKTDGTLWCWGGYFRGDTFVALTHPTQESTRSQDWSQIVLGVSDVCGVQHNGSLWCWEFGQRPTEVFSEYGWAWSSVDIGLNHVCGLTEDGRVWCWGDSSWGELGQGYVQRQPVPLQEQTQATDWSAVGSAGSHTCALKTDGSLWCWGFDDETGQPVTQPTAIRPNDRWSLFRHGSAMSCAIRTDGTLWCWGWSMLGRLGSGQTWEGQRMEPVQEATGATDWIDVSPAESFGHHSCGVRANGTLWCWGSNGIGQLGIPTAAWDYSLVPRQEQTRATDWAEVATGEGHTCARKQDGTVWCWGWNQFRQLGHERGFPFDTDRPIQESSLSRDWLSLASGSNHNCGLKADGTLWGWGQHTEGQLAIEFELVGLGGLAPAVQEHTYARDWLHVDAADTTVCGLKDNGSIWCWGHNALGNVGVVDAETVILPLQEASRGQDWRSVSAGSYTTCAIKNNGTLWCWGDIEGMAIDHGTRSNVPLPVP